MERIQHRVKSLINKIVHLAEKCLTECCVWNF